MSASRVMYPSDRSSHEEWRVQVKRLPVTMQPSLNQQINRWNELFPFEQRQAAHFLDSVVRIEPGELERLTRNLRGLEQRMHVVDWHFSLDLDTMENAAQLARSPLYGEWRREVQAVFSAIRARASLPAELEETAGRLMMIILPESLPVQSVSGRKPWAAGALEFHVDGDVRQISEQAVGGRAGLPGLFGAGAADRQREDASADCWLLDAEARLGALVSKSGKSPISLLQYSVLKPFRDQFLALVNTVPKDIEGADQILTRMRNQNWASSWPVQLAEQTRLRSFVVDLFLSGNGALIFPNAFVQWAASEAIRRARPRLIFARFGIRSKPKPFTSIAIFENQQQISALEDEGDPEGSAIDAVILARYIWLSALRYAEAKQTTCVWVCEATKSISVIAPDRRSPPWRSGTAVTPEQFHEWMRTCLT